MHLIAPGRRDRLPQAESLGAERVRCAVADGKRAISGSVAYSTAWFDVISKQDVGDKDPYYSLRMPDYVSVVAMTAQREVVLVRQYRPAVEVHTLELPAGHVEAGETPEEAARRELTEETGFSSPQFECLGTLLSDTGRNENRMWCFLAENLLPPSVSWAPEDGLEVVLVTVDDLHGMILRGEFSHALNIAALMVAVLRRVRCLSVLA